MNNFGTNNHWTRSELKGNAKNELKISYWLSFAASIIASFLLGGGAYGSATHSFGNNAKLELHVETAAQQISSLTDIPVFFDTVRNALTEWLFSPSFWLFAAAASLSGIIYSIFVALPIEVGHSHFYAACPQNHRKLSTLFSAFSGGRYFKSIGTMILSKIKIFLWSLLLVIPGIIKSYSYRMVPYIIAEHPELTAREAIGRSERMMQGNKWKSFKLDFSFIGWIILGAMCFGVGLLFVIPYINATHAQLYLKLRNEN